MIHIPILRAGKPYTSVEFVELVHHATRKPMARVSQANSGMVRRDVLLMNDRVLERFSVKELFAMTRRAGELFLSAPLPLGEKQQTFDDYVAQLSGSTGMPVSYCRANAGKIHKVMTEIDTVVRGLTRGFDETILDRGYGEHLGGTLSYFREGRTFGAVLPSNSPGVHSLWIPAIALKAPTVLKPGREEPWTPFRIIQSLIAAGVPAEAFGFYPTDHGGSGELLRTLHRSMLFGDTATTKQWAHDARVEIHGSGFSKVILGDDAAEHWQDYIDVMAGSIAANGGRSCINASGVWTPRYGREIAQALAAKFADVKALPAEDPKASIAAFANTQVAERISAVIDQGLLEPGAEDMTHPLRGDRLARIGPCAYLLPTVVHCSSADHPLANREFLFPFAAVVECPVNEIPERIGQTLVASVMTKDEAFQQKLMACSHIDRLNLGPVPTYQISWDQPHEGNLFEHLYRQRAFQKVDSAA